MFHRRRRANVWMRVAARAMSDTVSAGDVDGVAFGCTAALWLFGPARVLLFLRKKNP